MGLDCRYHERGGVTLKVLLIGIRQYADIASLSCDILRSFALSHPDIASRCTIRVREVADADDDATVLDEENAWDPDVIGFSSYVWSHERCLVLARSWKDLRPDRFVLMGGPHVHGIEADILRTNPPLDLVSFGDGELVFRDVLLRLLDGRALLDADGTGGIPGTVVRHGNGFQHSQGLTDDVPLDERASPYLDGSFFARVKEQHERTAMALVEQHRGCPFRCAFCFWGQNVKKVRWFDVARTKAELDALADHGVLDIYFTDSSFNMKRDRAKEILAHLGKRSFSWVAAHFEAKSLDEETIALMDGVENLVAMFGLQSVKRATLEQVHRLPDTRQLADQLAPLLDTRTRVILQVILGLPTDSPADFRSTLRFVQRMRNVPEVQAFHLQVLPGSEYWNRKEELALDYFPVAPHYLRSSPLLSPEDLGRMKLDAWMVVLYQNFDAFAFSQRLIDAVTETRVEWDGPMAVEDPPWAALLWALADRIWERVPRARQIPDGIFGRPEHTPSFLWPDAVSALIIEILEEKWGVVSALGAEFVHQAVALDAAMLRARVRPRVTRQRNADIRWHLDEADAEPDVHGRRVDRQIKESPPLHLDWPVCAFKSPEPAPPKKQTDVHIGFHGGRLLVIEASEASAR